MKKIILIGIILFSINAAAQTEAPPIKNLNFNSKQVKKKLIISGGLLMAGALTKTISTYHEEPDVKTYVDMERYSRDLNSWKQKQKDFSRVSSMFYGLSGISLISISFNF